MRLLSDKRRPARGPPAKVSSKRVNNRRNGRRALVVYPLYEPRVNLIAPHEVGTPMSKGRTVPERERPVLVIAVTSEAEAERLAQHAAKISGDDCGVMMRFHSQRCRAQYTGDPRHCSCKPTYRTVKPGGQD